MHFSEWSVLLEGNAMMQPLSRHAGCRRFMYLSIDEAGTHVGFNRFRLVVGVYDDTRQELLGTACCPPIRVLSNNDAPGGAPHLMLAVTIR